MQHQNTWLAARQRKRRRRPATRETDVTEQLTNELANAEPEAECRLVAPPQRVGCQQVTMMSAMMGPGQEGSQVANSCNRCKAQLGNEARQQHNDDLNSSNLRFFPPLTRTRAANLSKPAKHTKLNLIHVIASSHSSATSKFAPQLVLMVSLVYVVVVHCQQPNQNQRPQFSLPLQADPRADQQQQPNANGNSININNNKPAIDPSAYSQLVNWLASYRDQAANQRRSPVAQQMPTLPLNGRGTQQQSAPNPFGLQASSASAGQFQPARQRFPQAPSQQPLSAGSQPTLSFPSSTSSSPATPYLTLNRISSLAAASQQQQPATVAQNGRPAFGLNLQPINTVPLGQQPNGRPLTNSAGLMPPPRAIQQQSQIPRAPQLFNQLPSGGYNSNSNINNNQMRPSSTSSPPSVQVRPVAGFAPSGPPPTPIAGQSALSVVPSPIQQPSAAQQNPNINRSEPTLTTTIAPNEVTTLTSTTSNFEESEESSSRPTEQAISQASSSMGTTTQAAVDQTTTTMPTSESSWAPVELNRTSAGGSDTQDKGPTLAPSPDIVTVPPGYNPDSPQPPQNYDIPVTAQMGAGSKLQPPAQDLTTPPPTALNQSVSFSTSSTPILAAPTEPTTIYWTPPATSEPSSLISTIVPPKPTSQQVQPTRTSSLTTATTTIAPTRIRDNNSLAVENPAETGVVYGKSQGRDSKPPPPVAQPNPTPVGPSQATFETPIPGRPFIQPVQMDNQVRPFAAGTGNTQTGASGQEQPALIKKSNHQANFRPSRPLNANGREPPVQVNSVFQIAASGNQTMPTGDIQDYVAAQPPLLIPSTQQHEPTISGHGGPDPAAGHSPDLNASESHKSETHHHHPSKHLSNGTGEPPASQLTTLAAPTSNQQPRLRRPTFKPKPAVPPIRIDSCIVDDESSCDQSHNERCVTEYGISSCHCKPGFARLSQLRGYCSPVSSLQLSLKIDKLSDDRRLAYNQSLADSNSEEYQYLEFETIQALASAFQQSSLAKQFMGARVNKFFERKGKVHANVSLNFDANNITKVATQITNLVGQELGKQVSQVAKAQRPLGDSTIMLDGSKESVSRLADLNECASRDLNDCSKFATCTNDFGSFQCQCLPGYDDKYGQLEDKSKHGRVCLGCSASYCSNRGECTIQDGEKRCKCRPNFIGARCDIDTEVLAVAIGGSIVGIIILISTFWCLYVFNRRWKREQQKMDAMSATSGLTYNYVNSANSTNSLMSPGRLMVQAGTGLASAATTAGGGGGLHRSGGHQVGAMAAQYGQRFGAALTSGRQHYAPDQQAIIGSTSSGSSAASQPICGGPYAPASAYHQQYEDAGLLIAPASTGSSEQTSPTSNSYRGIMASQQHPSLMAAGNAYTLSGHHHHAHPHHAHLHQHHHHKAANQQLSQFHPAAGDYRTLNTSHPIQQQAYDGRWRTLQQEHNKQSSGLVGYYLSPDMLVGQQQQLYASPQRELCIDTGNGNKARSRQQGRALQAGHTLRSRPQSQHLLNAKPSIYHSDYDHH